MIFSFLVGSLTSWVSPWSAMILSSRSELKDQFVVGSRSFHLWSGALKSPATITLFVLDLLPNLNKDESNSCRLSISFLFGR